MVSTYESKNTLLSPPQGLSTELTSSIVTPPSHVFQETNLPHPNPGENKKKIPYSIYIIRVGLLGDCNVNIHEVQNISSTYLQATTSGGIMFT